MEPSERKTEEFEQALARARAAKVTLKLFIAGMGARSTRAVVDGKRLRDALGERCSLEIIDIYEHPEAAAEAQIVAVPTLVREQPLPRRKLIGAIGDVTRVLRSLKLLPLPAAGAG